MGGWNGGSDRRRGRFWALGSSGGLLAIAAVMVLAPAAAGAVHTSVVLKAPYKHFTVATFSTTSAVACGKAKVVSAPHFIPKTGLGGFADSGVAPACPTLPPNIANRGDASSQFSIVVPIKPIGTHIFVIASWNFTASGIEHLLSGKCVNTAAASSNCYQSAEFYLFGDAYLLDTTNGSTYFSSNFWPGVFNLSSNYTFCSSGACTHTVSGGTGGAFSGASPFSWYVNATTLNKTDSFVLEVDVFGGVLTELDGYNAHVTGGHADATLNFASTGNGAKLNSLTIT